ncbi:MAG: hypothetical protein JJU36_15900 [Phycisphaeraceae bacterium]|nr:hypothetical protein [Phycisphaeraceae bacterium]
MWYVFRSINGVPFDEYRIRAVNIERLDDSDLYLISVELSEGSDYADVLAGFEIAQNTLSHMIIEILSW